MSKLIYANIDRKQVISFFEHMDNFNVYHKLEGNSITFVSNNKSYMAMFETPVLNKVTNFFVDIKSLVIALNSKLIHCMVIQNESNDDMIVIAIDDFGYDTSICDVLKGN